MHKMPLLTATKSLDEEQPINRKPSRKVSVPSAFLRKPSTFQRQVVLNYSFPPASLQIQRQNGRNVRRGSTFSMASSSAGGKRSKKGVAEDFRGNAVSNIVSSIILGKSELVEQLANNGIDMLGPTRLVFSDQVPSSRPVAPMDVTQLKGAAGLMSTLTMDETDGGVLVDRHIMVSLLHLAVLERQVDSVKNIIDYISSSNDKQGDKADFIHRMLTAKVEVEVPGSKAIDYNQDEISMDGLNAVHLAAQYSVECLDLFLNGPLAAEVSTILDLTNAYGETALHLAASNLDSGSVRLLLECGASVLGVDTKRDTPLHVAAKTGSNESVGLLLDHGSPIQARNGKGRTCLFYARSPRMVTLLLYYGADVMAKDNTGILVLEYFLKKNPANAKAILADGVETNGKSEGASDLLLIYDLNLFKQCTEVTDEEGVLHKRPDEMGTISKFLDYRRKALLREPLVETFLHLKWLSLRKFMFFNLTLYGLFVLAITSLTIWSTNIYVEKINRTQTDDDATYFPLSYDNNSTGYFFRDVENDNGLKLGAIALYIITIIFTLWPTVREFLQFMNDPCSYIRSKENWAEVLLIFLSWTWLFLLPISDDNAEWLPGFKTDIGAANIFLAWMVMTYLIGRFPSIGIYVYMSTKVVKQVFQFFIVYATTLLAFTFAFTILMPRHHIFENWFSSLLKVIVMMTGEFEFENNFTFEKAEVFGVSKNSNYWMTQALFIGFVFFVTIIISNLIIGLTINNTKELFKEAGMYRLGKTVKQILETEQILIKGKWGKCLTSYMPKTFDNMMAENMQIFLLLTKFQKKSKVDTTKLCVKPYTTKAQKGDLTKGLMGVDNSDYEIYLFNEDKNKADKSIKMCLPGWIIDNTFKCLKEKEERIEDVLKMQNRALLTQVEFGDRSYRSSHDRISGSSQIFPDGTPVAHREVLRGRFSTERKPRASLMVNDTIREEDHNRGVSVTESLRFADDEDISDSDRDINDENKVEIESDQNINYGCGKNLDIASKIEKLPEIQENLQQDIKKLKKILDIERSSSIPFDGDIDTTHV